MRFRVPVYFITIFGVQQLRQFIYEIYPPHFCSSFLSVFLYRIGPKSGTGAQWGWSQGPYAHRHHPCTGGKQHSHRLYHRNFYGSHHRIALCHGLFAGRMEKLIKSEDFKRWYSGGIQEKYIYYFKRNPPTPEFINIRVSLKNRCIR